MKYPQRIEPSKMLIKVLRAVIIGAPGSGKGTISSRIVKCFGLHHISSGDMLRLNAVQNTDIGNQAHKYMEASQLVPDDIVVHLIMNELKKYPTSNWLLDGFPRTKSQAEILEKEAHINIAINLVVPAEVIIARVAGRWTHLPSGRVYNKDFNPPKVAGFDDVTGEPLVQRSDDTPQAVNKRLELHNSTFQPILDFYQQKGVLKTFTGTETNKIWPHVYQYLATIAEPKLPVS